MDVLASGGIAPRFLTSGRVTLAVVKPMSDETTFVGANLIPDSGHEFTAEEINYIEAQGCTIAEIREAIGKVPPAQLGEGISLDALIGEANGQKSQPAGAVEPNVIDPSDPRNEGKTGVENAGG